MCAGFPRSISHGSRGPGMLELDTLEPAGPLNAFGNFDQGCFIMYLSLARIVQNLIPGLGLDLRETAPLSRISPSKPTYLTAHFQCPSYWGARRGYSASPPFAWYPHLHGTPICMPQTSKTEYPKVLQGVVIAYR